MPSIDEDILHDLMHRATDDLHASPGVAAAIAGDRRRRHLRTRAIGVTVTGVAAATAVGVAAVAAGTRQASAGQHGRSAPDQADDHVDRVGAGTQPAKPGGGRRQDRLRSLRRDVRA